MTGEAPSYHDLYVTTPKNARTRLFDLPYAVEVTCTRAAGWRVWVTEGATEVDGSGLRHLIAGEYDGPEYWLVLDVAGHVICDSRRAEPELAADDALQP